MPYVVSAFKCDPLDCVVKISVSEPARLTVITKEKQEREKQLWHEISLTIALTDRDSLEFLEFLKLEMYGKDHYF